MSSTVYIATYVDIQRHRTAEGVNLIRAYGDIVRVQPGNVSIRLLQETTRPNRFMIIEAWNDQSGFASHEEAAPTQQFRAKLKTIYSNPYDQRVHNAFSVGSDGAAITPSSICVVTHVDVPPPRKDECETLLRRLADRSRNERGNMRYDVFQQTSRTNHFTVFAVWTDAETFESHETSAHRMEFREALWPLLGAPYDERLFKLLNA